MKTYVAIGIVWSSAILLALLAWATIATLQTYDCHHEGTCEVESRE